MVKVLIIGAGAIGRGFLPWCLPPSAKITFVDISTSLVDGLRGAGKYTTYLSSDGKLKSMQVSPHAVLRPSDVQAQELPEFDIAFISVGPRNIEKIPPDLGRLRCPIFTLENDPATTFRLRELLQNEQVYFGVPDVITSSTASPENLECDPWAIHTEDGVLYLTGVPMSSETKLLRVKWINEEKLSLEWGAKLYIHNTAHCIAAYLGYLMGKVYMHDAMQVTAVSDIVRGVLEEIVASLGKSSLYSSVFLKSYASKELARFQDVLLFDPISRVARHPLRKLRPAPHGRLIGALDLCLLAGVFPKNLLTGIAAALHYDNEADDDSASLGLIKYYGISAFLSHFLGIPEDSLTSKLVSKSYREFDPSRLK